MSIRTTISSLVTMVIVLSILVGLCGVWLLAASPVSTRAEGYIGAVMLLAMIVILFLGRKLHFQGPWVAPLRIISIFLAIFFDRALFDLARGVYYWWLWNRQPDCGPHPFCCRNIFGRICVVRLLRQCKPAPSYPSTITF